MEKRSETCPWCQEEVWVEPGRHRTYRCTSCGRNFAFVSAESGPPPTPLSPSMPFQEFVETPYVKELAARCLAYLRDGLSVHLSGPAGCGKTTLALYVAHQIGRPVVLIHGDEQMGTSDLVGKESGLKRRYSRDQFTLAMVKVEEEARPLWMDKALAEACREGYTLVYDEFTRSRPETNNVLLSVLGERILPLRDSPMPVHPDFRAIFTSNPTEYAGVHSAQDALLDRMVTIFLPGLDRDTEVAIAQARSGLPRTEVERIVDLVRAFRGSGLKTNVSSVRTCIMLARILHIRGGRAHAGDPVFIQACRDVLLSEVRRRGLNQAKDQQSERFLTRLVQELCSAPLPPEQPPPEATAPKTEPERLMRDLFQDPEVEALLLRKMRERGLAG